MNPTVYAQNERVATGRLGNRNDQFLAQRVEGFGDAVYFGGVREGGEPVDFLLADFQAFG